MFRRSSVSIAKKRLRNLVTADRVSAIPESYDILSRELFNLLSRYIEITEDDFKLEIFRTHILIHITGENL